MMPSRKSLMTNWSKDSKKQKEDATREEEDLKKA